MGGLTKSGTGALTLSVANTFAGTTAVSGGTLCLAHPRAVQNSTVNVNPSGVLGFATGNTNPILGGLMGAGNVVLATAASEPVTLSVGNNGQSTTYSGVLSGPGSLVKQGAGILTLTSAQSYTGPTVINSGTLKLQGPGYGALSLTTFTSDATSGISSSNTYTEALAFAAGSPLNINGVTFANANNSGGTGKLGSSWSINVPAYVASGNFPAGFQPVSGQGTYSLLNQFYYEGGSDTTPVTLTLTGLVPGQSYDARLFYREYSQNDNRIANFTFSNGVSTQTATVNEDVDADGHYIDYPYTAGPTGTVTISEADNVNMLAGGSWHWYGFTNQLTGTSNLLRKTTALSIAAGSSLDLGGVSQQVASLSDAALGSGGSVINSNTGSASVLSLSPTGSKTFSGAIQGGGTLGMISLTISGVGTQVLAGSNSYSGATTIGQGKLVVDGWLSNSAVSVNGGTLGGMGHLGSVTVDASGTLAPGDPQGVLNLSGNLVLAAGAAMDFELDGVSTDDEVSMPLGSLTFTGQQFSNFGFTWSAGFGPGTYMLVNAESISGLGSNLSGTIDGLPATLSVSNNNLMLTVVPEPGTLALFGVGVGCLVGAGYVRRDSHRRKTASLVPVRGVEGSFKRGVY